MAQRQMPTAECTLVQKALSRCLGEGGGVPSHSSPSPGEWGAIAPCICHDTGHRRPASKHAVWQAPDWESPSCPCPTGSEEGAGPAGPKAARHSTLGWPSRGPGCSGSYQSRVHWRCRAAEGRPGQ